MFLNSFAFSALCFFPLICAHLTRCTMSVSFAICYPRHFLIYLEGGGTASESIAAPHFPSLSQLALKPKSRNP
jgi:hypothetical protein